MQLLRKSGISKTKNSISKAFALFVVIFFVALFGMVVMPTKANAIVNGEIDSQPWAVALVKPNDGSPIESRTFCSGVLVKARWVLTAAHCKAHLRIGDTAVIGRRQLASTAGDTRRVTAIVDMRANATYCNVSNKDDLCDLALLKLDSESSQKDANLANASVLSEWGPNSSARAYGYGQTARYSSMSSYLRRGHHQITDLRDNHFTLFAKGINSSVCYGDSGGPLIVSTSTGPKVVGIVRAAPNHATDSSICKPGSTNSFVKVGYRGSFANSRPFLWIQSVVN